MKHTYICEGKTQMIKSLENGQSFEIQVGDMNKLELFVREIEFSGFTLTKFIVITFLEYDGDEFDHESDKTIKSYNCRNSEYYLADNQKEIEMAFAAFAKRVINPIRPSTFSRSLDDFVTKKS